MSHPQWHANCSLKRRCHQRSAVTAMFHQQSILALIEWLSKWCWHQRSPDAAVSQIIPPDPCTQWTACGMVSPGMTGSITVSCQCPLLVRSGHAASCWCFASDSPHANSHTLHGQQGWRALPSECAHHPCFPVQGHCAAGWSKCFQWPIHIHQMVGCRTPCTPLRVCTPPQLPNLGPLNRRQSGQLHFQWPIHIHQMAGCRTPCTPLRVVTPPQLPNPGQHHHWCWAKDSLADFIVSGNSLAAKWCSEHTITTLQNPGLKLADIYHAKF